MSERNRALGLRWLEEVRNRRMDATIDELLSEDAVGQMEDAERVGPKEFREIRAAAAKP